MNGLIQAMKDGFNDGKKRARSEARLARARRTHDVKVIVFERTGEVNIATLCGNTVCRKNLTDFQPCPAELLKCVPGEIVDFCRSVTPHYLYLTEREDGRSIWESTGEPVEI